jgi:hypothetical protein
MLYPNLTYQSLMETQPVTMTACSMALTVLGGLAAQCAGISAEEAKHDWFAGLIPGVVAVPSGVYAMNLAQEAGCTF